MIRVLYYTEAQRDRAFDRINAKYGSNEYPGAKGQEYVYFWIELIENGEWLFYPDELERSHEVTNTFTVINNPTTSKSFDFANIVDYHRIELYGLGATSAETDAIIQSYCDNYGSQPVGDKHLHLGYNGYDIDLANGSPSQPMIDLFTSTVSGSILVYFDGTQNQTIIT